MLSWAHFFNLDKSLRDGGRFVIFEEYASLIEETETYGRHYRNHNLGEAIMEVRKHGFNVIDNFEISGSWGIMAVKI